MNGVLVVGIEATHPNVIHVHKLCVDWYASTISHALGVMTNQFTTNLPVCMVDDVISFIN